MEEEKCLSSLRNLVGAVNQALLANQLEASIKLVEDESFLPTNEGTNRDEDRPIVRNYHPIFDDEGRFLCAVKFLRSDSSQRTGRLVLTEEIMNIFDSSYDGIWITDGEGIVLFSNRANERLTGIKREMVVGKSTKELVDNKVVIKSAALEVLSTKKRVTIMGFNPKTEKHVLITGTPIFDEEGNIILVINNIRDITDLDNLRKKNESNRELISRQEEELQELRSIKKAMQKDIVSKSPKMREIFDMTQRIGRFDLTVLILGESGAGKEVVAESIVKYSDRRDKAFIKVNCGAIPEQLLESELFGYEKGAFTGASQKGKAGMFELAEGGTILLDEVADIPLNLQVKLLRAIQGKEIMRLGGTKTIKLDVRILAATNKNIEQMVADGTFREDLYYRLNVATITVPPLRERLEDIPSLITHFINRFTTVHQVEKRIDHRTVEVLTEYSWPGNVRELENLIENLVVLTRDETITLKDLPVKIYREEKSSNMPMIEIDGIIPLKKGVDMLEEHLIKKAMEKYGSTRKAARALGVDQSTIVRKIQKWHNE